MLTRGARRHRRARDTTTTLSSDDDDDGDESNVDEASYARLASYMPSTSNRLLLDDDDDDDDDDDESIIPLRADDATLSFGGGGDDDTSLPAAAAPAAASSSSRAAPSSSRAAPPVAAAKRERASRTFPTTGASFRSYHIVDDERYQSYRAGDVDTSVPPDNVAGWIQRRIDFRERLETLPWYRQAVMVAAYAGVPLKDIVYIPSVNARRRRTSLFGGGGSVGGIGDTSFLNRLVRFRGDAQPAPAAPQPAPAAGGADVEEQLRSLLEQQTALRQAVERIDTKAERHVVELQKRIAELRAEQQASLVKGLETVDKELSKREQASQAELAAATQSLRTLVATFNVGVRGDLTALVERIATLEDGGARERLALERGLREALARVDSKADEASVNVRAIEETFGRLATDFSVAVKTRETLRSDFDAFVNEIEERLTRFPRKPERQVRRAQSERLPYSSSHRPLPTAISGPSVTYVKELADLQEKLEQAIRNRNLNPDLMDATVTNTKRRAQLLALLKQLEDQLAASLDAVRREEPETTGLVFTNPAWPAHQQLAVQMVRQRFPQTLARATIASFERSPTCDMLFALITAALFNRGIFVAGRRPQRASDYRRYEDGIGYAMRELRFAAYNARADRVDMNYTAVAEFRDAAVARAPSCTTLLSYGSSPYPSSSSSSTTASAFSFSPRAASAHALRSTLLTAPGFASLEGRPARVSPYGKRVIGFGERRV